jgi:hypothetical protein
MAHLGFQAQPTTTPKITAIHSGAMKVTRFPKMSITTTVELRNMLLLFVPRLNRKDKRESAAINVVVVGRGENWNQWKKNG